MSKTADRLNRIEKQLEELVTLMRILVLRSAENPVMTDDAEDIIVPSVPHIPPVLPSPPVIIPTQPWPQTPELPTNPSKTSCTKCGMVFDGFMGYVCQDPACPMGCGPVTC